MTERERQTTDGHDSVLDRTTRLFEFLARTQQIKTKTPSTFEAYRRDGEVLWFSELPEHPAVSSVHGVSQPEPSDALLVVDRVPRLAPPEPSVDLQVWIEGERTDAQAEPSLRDEITVLRESSEPHEEQRSSIRRREGEPELAARLDEWLQRWRAWAEQERAAEPVRDLYGRLFSAYLTATAHPEERELVVGVGCLGWRPPSHEPVQRHLLTAPVRIQFDEHTGRLTVARAESQDALSVELDMLEPGLVHSPARVQEIRSEARDLLAHPLDRDEAGKLARRLVHILDSDGRYLDEDEHPVPGESPVAAFAPAVIMRKRSQQGLVDIFKAIIEQLRVSGEVPEGIRPLVDPNHTPDPGLAWDERNGAVATVDDEPFLPLPVNEAQLKVIRRVDSSAQTLVQGPPGTGKTHTAAALIAHLLAQGKRVLVTAQTDRALREVRDKLPEAIKPLSVAVVGASREDMADLRVAVERIGQQAAEHEPEAAAREIQSHLGAIEDLRRQRAAVYRALLDAREVEIQTHQRGRYHGTLAVIARQHQADSVRLGWIRGLVSPSPDDSCPLADVAAAEWLDCLVSDVLAADEAEAHQDLLDPSSLVDPEVFAGLVTEEQAASSAAASHEALQQHKAFEAMAELEEGTRTEVQERLRALAQEAESLAARREQWMNEALADVCAGKHGAWAARFKQLTELISTVTPMVERLGPLTEVQADLSEAGRLVPLATAVRQHLAEGGKIRTELGGRPRIGAFSKRILKDSADLFEKVRVDGVPPTTAEQLDTFLTWVEAQRCLTGLNKAWPASVTIPAEDTLSERLHWHVTELALLRRVLVLARELRQQEKRLGELGVPTPDWNDLTEVRTFSQLVDAASAVDARTQAREPLEHLAAALTDAARWQDAAPAVHALKAAVDSRDPQVYRAAHQRLLHLLKVRDASDRRDELSDQLAAAAPLLRQAVEETAGDPAWSARLAQLNEAWHWAATASWIQAQEQVDVNALQADLALIEDRIRGHVEHTSAGRAWAHAIAPGRLPGEARANLQQYAQLVRRLGKGTGKYAQQRRREIRQAMDRCRPSVPVWIMPIYRIAEQLRVAQDMFDVVIVDEASQAGLEATFLQYLAPKIVVVGDDKQVSPAAVGIDQQQLRDLANQFLHDDLYIASWQDPKRSLFDEARMRYGGLITLVEHRRCVPEIIGFSNRVAYEPEGIRLIPVRQYGSDRLEPIKPVFLPDGYTRGDRHKVNPVEVEALVEQLEKCIADPAYDGKTVGVISLLGDAQAKTIEKELMENLPPEEWAARELRCGNSADFQGSERDVMFLSMVAVPEPGRRLQPLTSEMWLQRFNVAASRAKDQLWLFHSVRLDDIVNPGCMRFQLLDYCAGVAARSQETDERAVTEQEPEDRRVEPFDSLFEQRVCNRLLDRGFTVLPQYPVEGYRIDLVVVGAKARLAVECDGDTWHGPDAYEADLGRQRELERCGWRFVRVRESAFYVDPAAALQPLWEALEDLEIRPSGWIAPEPDPRPAAAGVNRGNISPEVRSTPATRPVEDEPRSPVAREPQPTPEPQAVATMTGTPAPTALPQDEDKEEAAPEPAASRDSVGRATTQSHRNVLAPYPEFTGSTTPALEATRDQISAGLLAIVEAEGPVLGHRLHQAYVKGSGGHRVGKQIGKVLNSAVARAVRRGLLVEDDPLGEAGVRPKTYRLPEQPEVRLRELGPRPLEYVPPRELATVIREVAAEVGASDHQVLYRRTLERLGLKRLTRNAEARLGQVRQLLEIDVV